MARRNLQATTSRKKSRQDLAKEIQEAVRIHLPDRDRSYDPIVELALVGANPRISAELRTQANREVAGYLYHKLKSVDLTVSQDGPITVQVIDFSKIGPDTSAAQLIEMSNQLDKELIEDDDEED